MCPAAHYHRGFIQITPKFLDLQAKTCDDELKDFVKEKAPFKLNDYKSHRVAIEDSPETVVENYKKYMEGPEMPSEGDKMTHEFLQFGNIKLSIFTPKNQRPPAGGRPCLYFIHGGGFVVNNQCSGITSIFPCIDRLNAVCVSIDYSVAPECKAPSQVEQCYDGLLAFWNRKKYSGEINFDEVAVIGRSAGAALLVGLNLKILEGKEMKIRCNIMTFPMVDDACNTGSHSKFRNAPFLPHETVKDCWGHYLNHRGGDKYVVPGKATIKDLEEFPPTLVEVAKADVLHDEGVNFYEKLNSAGVGITIKSFNGYHCFDSTDTEISKRAKRERVEFLEEQGMRPIR
ncbi:vegetative specific protein H5, putative [Talaromyces stipitatus ATCC 10500]|uniref:Vegetative specific protein H5, putative n=1 Tax=Talaromyces stipitatus (strain ATCC 10500 / CBS 375.48 / QM 6759 / NRRL 1006) TaxID=441959 RepID=B8LX09_TALSN|nr:vegetative specific protein H5, putative [Talaromyces stipitatus ATCC 10500]EED24642.1 vegetative specific protein H5, putative [Talaromyces stipitatus ATCC 10500]